MELDFLLNVNFLLSRCSSFLLLLGRGLFPNCCQGSCVLAGLRTPHLKGLSAKFSVVVTNVHHVT